MAKKPPNAGKRWSSSEIAELKKLAKGNTPTRVIGLKLERTPAAVESKAQDEGIPLNPPNQSPYGTKH